MQKSQKPRLFEGLRAGDLKKMISHRFTVDQYKSKMGLDEDIIVVAFKVKDKYPAIDLMEFIEKGYPDVLDADMSTGEERDGEYRVFVEFERCPKTAKCLADVIRGISQLADTYEWHFKYFKDVDGHNFSEESFSEFVPLTKDAYKARVKEQTVAEVSDVLDQGPAEVADIDESNNLTFTKLYSGDLTVKLEAIGDYHSLQESLKGGLQLDESSIHQVAFLQKYLGNYAIHKIDDRFLIRNEDQAIIIRKDIW